MVGADVYRPAAIKQLQVLGEQTGIEVYSEENHQDAVGICESPAKAKRTWFNLHDNRYSWKITYR